MEEEEEEKTKPPPYTHPHAGARDANGDWGYVPDVTIVRQRHFQLYNNTEYAIVTDHPKGSEKYEYACNREVYQGWEGKSGLGAMGKVQINGPTPINDTLLSPTTSSTATTAATAKTAPKVLCVIYTYDKNHPRIEANVNTWAWKCDGFFAASTLTNETIGTIDLPHYGDEAYNNMWQKTRSIFGYVYDHYMKDYDFVWVGGDDYYLIVENLINILSEFHTEEYEQQALLLGKPVPHRGGVFCGGGPGYVMNKMGVKRFVEEVLPTCAVRLFRVRFCILLERNVFI